MINFKCFFRHIWEYKFLDGGTIAMNYLGNFQGEVSGSFRFCTRCHRKEERYRNDSRIIWSKVNHYTSDELREIRLSKILNNDNN